MSILSFPDRGKWGKSSWRGNCSGYIYQSMFQQYAPKSFCDPMMGSGTSIEVATEMGITAFGLDLHAGFNVLRDSIVNTIGQQVDMCFSHPPYGSMVLYSGEQWGDPHPDDLSRCTDDNDFHEKMHLALLNQREATLPGGMYGMLIGDLRKNGKYVSYQAEQIARMPADELSAVIIKAQHNCVSDARQYSKMKHFRIMHEYIVLWTKPLSPVSILMDLSNMARQCQARMRSTWKMVLINAMMFLGKKACLESLYEQIAKSAPDKLSCNKHWREKIRQTLQLHSCFVSHGDGVWGLV